jgi:hypothetical protein
VSVPALGAERARLFLNDLVVQHIFLSLCLSVSLCIYLPISDSFNLFFQAFAPHSNLIDNWNPAIRSGVD